MWNIKIQCFYPPRILNENYFFTNSAQRELVSICTRRVYATAINFPCIITLGKGIYKFTKSSRRSQTPLQYSTMNGATNTEDQITSAIVRKNSRLLFAPIQINLVKSKITFDKKKSVKKSIKNNLNKSVKSRSIFKISIQLVLVQSNLNSVYIF